MDNVTYIRPATSKPTSDEMLRQDVERLKSLVLEMSEEQQELKTQLTYVKDKLESAYKYLAKIVTKLGWS